MSGDQGDVWWGPAPHKADPAYRPWLVVSDSSHPFADEESIVVGLTTQRHPDSIPVPDDAWIRGGSEKRAYISPWYVTTVKDRDLDNLQGTLAESLVVEAIETLHQYTPVPGN
ncbi:type II toxin-antitoxin system PemK/MazF family toxin [Halorhabdus salina]|uniref:type II toxin-antitoxin system PemK/MazF family toxin n=1 Tax=Halorhabdus salina TaxID=2750670 RepID=UPI0015EED337|nr:type II toxin-antitoxin system PemK/MazF family toxin [Halorhabdus salina]